MHALSSPSPVSSFKTFRRGALLLSLGVIASSLQMQPSNAAIVATAFGPHGEAGDLNGLPLTFGTTGSVFELDSYLYTAGSDINGNDPGTALNLSRVAPGVIDKFSLSHELSPTGDRLRLTYQFTNLARVPMEMRFFFFVDPESAGDISYSDEFGSADGPLGSGPGDAAVDFWEIDEPGFVTGDIISHLLNGTLDNANEVPAQMPGDVALAIGFDLGVVAPFETILARLSLSDGGMADDAFSLRLHDAIVPGDTLAVSGSASVIPGVDGDFNGDESVDGSDLLAWQRSLGSAADLAADGNLDSRVDAADLAIWKAAFGTPVGDYDGNGTVDGSDLLAWQRGLGSTTDLLADGNRNGAVDADDLAIWRRTFGGSAPGNDSAPASLAVPEPQSALLALIAAAFLCQLVRANMSSEGS